MDDAAPAPARTVDADVAASIRAAMAAAARSQIEAVLARQADELARLDGHSRHDSRLQTVYFDGVKIEGVRVPRVRTPDGIRMPPLYAELRAARREETVRLARDGYS
ncbi:MAG: hypothetical protein GXY03_01100, partial [Solirubrobacterales bacterium]|nr:hypothetical protein [Solirubrobacterales bacterium]